MADNANKKSKHSGAANLAAATALLAPLLACGAAEAPAKGLPAEPQSSSEPADAVTTDDDKTDGDKTDAHGIPPDPKEESPQPKGVRG